MRDLNQRIQNVSCNHARSRYNGFSLVELLVVIAIITLLASLLFPVMAGAKRQAYSSECVNNLRQMGIALNLYTQDANAYPLATANGIMGAWQEPLRLMSPGLTFDCPVQVLPSATFVKIFSWTSGLISPYYGYNVMGAVYEGSPPYNPGLGGDVNPDGSRVPTGVNRVVNPAQMIMVGDSATFLAVRSGTQPQINIPNQIFLVFPYPVPVINSAGVGNWHDLGANMVFGDGHVEHASQTYWIAATDQSRRRWNNDNQPHEEWW